MAKAGTRRAREPLSRERIEEAALALIERGGLEDFSTRRLAAELGCEAMSIYHYYPGKAHLLDAVFDRVVGGLPADDPGLPWRVRIETLVFAYRAMAHRYPRFFPFVALHRHNTRVGLAWLERMLGVFRDAGLDTETAARFFRIVGYYVIGAALDETAGYAKGHSAAEPVPDSEVEASFPEVTAVNRYFRAAEHEATFRLGLAALLDRIEAAAEGGGQGLRPLPEEDVDAARPASPRARSSRSSSR
jgi:AcrR family transcriptional regulator